MDKDLIEHLATLPSILCESCGSIPPSAQCCGLALCKRCKRNHDNLTLSHNESSAQTVTATESMQNIVKKAIEQDARISEMGDLYLESKNATEAEINRITHLNQELMHTLNQVSEENKTLRQLCEKYREIMESYEEEKKTTGIERLAKPTPTIPKSLAKPTLKRQSGKVAKLS